MDTVTIIRVVAGALAAALFMIIVWRRHKATD